MGFIVTKSAITLNFQKEKPTMYKLSLQSLPPVTFEQLISDVAESCGVNTTMSRAVVEGMINRMCRFMELGHTVQMGDFGSFKPTFSTKAQKTKDTVGADNVKSRRIRFYPGKRFKATLQKMTFINMSGGSLSGAEGNETPGNPGDGGSGGGTDFE